MSTKSFVGVTAGLTALVMGAIVAVSALPSSAATDYTFLVRGFVESVDKANNRLVVTGTWASTAQAVTETQSKVINYSIKDSDIYKWEDDKKILRDINHLEVGQEVVMKGKKVSGTFSPDWVVINDNAFVVVGRVTDYDTDNNWIKVKVGRSTLKQAGIVNTEIKFHYTSSTKCMRLGSEIGCSEITNQNQGIKLRGVKSSVSGQWDLNNAWNNYPI